MRDWQMGNSGDGKKISAVLFRMEKRKTASGALTICMEKPVIPGWIEMVRVIPVNFFGKRKKVIPSEVLLLSLFHRDFRKFPYRLSLTCCQAPWATFPGRNERWRIRVMNPCRYRPFMVVTDVSFLRHCYRYSCNTAVALQPCTRRLSPQYDRQSEFLCPNETIP